MDDMSNRTLCLLLAGQVNLGRDTKLPKKGDKHVCICSSSFHITSDCDHLVNWEEERDPDNL